MADCFTLWVVHANDAMQNFAVRVMCALFAHGCIQLMRTVTEDNLGHFPPVAATHLKWIGAVGFFPSNVVNRGICYQNVCPSVHPSVRLSHSWSTPLRFKISKYFTSYGRMMFPISSGQISQWWIVQEFTSNEFVKSKHPSPLDSDLSLSPSRQRNAARGYLRGPPDQ